MLISDFQKNAGRRPTSTAAAGRHHVLRRCRSATSTRRNLSVAPVAVRRGTLRGPGARHDHRRASPTAAVSRPTASTLTLELDGRVGGDGRASTVAPQASASARLRADHASRRRRLRGVVRIGDDALAADNAFHFVLRADAGRSPCCWPAPAARGADDTYLRRALAIGESPRFDVTAATARRADRRGARPRPGGHRATTRRSATRRSRRLAGFAERGGGVLVVAGSRGRRGRRARRMPGALADPVDRSRGAPGA